MVTSLYHVPVREFSPCVATVARLACAVEAIRHVQAGARPKLVCRWLQDANGCLTSHWEIEATTSIPIPPD
jgi:hypothetical protein